ncbi:MAG TPA: TetR/AcrR family transcriptional regulator [Myxococcales bacterium]|jgi:AcrR family transcriptional regulator|nr:TetR/AcrR family transcriptional regulator [Myxococcales bacterium]
MSPRVYSSARDRILAAAERLIRAGGLGQVTVEAVAAEAKVSKGGFFHHFASKEDLLLAMLERLVEAVRASIEKRAAGDPEPRGARLRAQIALAFDAGKESFEQWMSLIPAFLQAASAQPALVKRSRQINAEVLARDEGEDIPIGRSIAIQMALDGYGLAMGLGTTALTPRQQAAFRDSLMALAWPEAKAPNQSKSTRRKP